jgi:drug/metabolite transporter (DMT)-like permease
LTFLFSWGLGQEKIHIIQLLGLALTLSGAYWVSILVLRAHPEQPPEAFFEG